MPRLAKFLRLPHSDRLLLVEAAVWLGMARLSVMLVPFRRIAPFLGRHMSESTQSIEPGYRNLAERISWAVGTASRHVPWKCECLAQALAGKAMLKRRGVGSTLYLGVAKDNGENLKAHAWLRSGDLFVTGVWNANQFTVISTFAEEKH